MTLTPLAAYNFDEASGNVLDATGGGRDFALASPSIRTVSGHTNGGLTQSSAGIFTVSASQLTGLQTANRTIMAWVKETTSVTGWVLEWNDSAIDSGCWGILFLSGQWNIQARNAGGFVRAAVSRPTDSLFHHFAGTYDGTNVRAYLNGTLVATQALAGPLRTADVYRFQDQSSSAITIDDVRYFDYALNATEIAAWRDTPVTAGRSGKPKVWSGSAWVAHPAKTWSGSAWVTHPIKGYDGSIWVPSK